MALAYVPPGVSVEEVINPTFSPLLATPTSIGIVGPAQGFSTNSEIVVLSDRDPVTLSLDGIDTASLTVVDANDPTSTPFVSGTDFNYDPVLNTLSRAMQTRIDNGEQVTVYYENPTGVGWTEFAVLDGLSGYAPQHRGTTLVPSNIYVQHQGILPTSDYIITLGGSPQIRVSDSPTVLATESRQTIYIDYDDTSLQSHVQNVALTLNGTTNIGLPDFGTNFVIKNAPTTSLDSAFVFTRGTTSDQDYVLVGLSNSNTGENVTIARSAGTTQMGVGTNQLQVRVSYTATPSDYFLPTRVFSQSDVETKYGPALDSFGNVSSPVSLAASLAFSNGASDLVVQAVYHLADASDDDSIKTIGGASSDATINLADWRSTLRGIRDIEDINVLVPIVSTGTGVTNDSLTLGIFQAVQSHLEFMAQQNQYIVALLGEDSSAAGNVADKLTLQNHALALGATPAAEATVLAAPSSFTWANPVTGTATVLGGQYIMAAVAGVMAANDVEASLTRRQIAGIVGVKDFRSEMDKNADAAAGLMVIENRQGVVRVRDAVTTSTDSVNTRELNVVRAKHFMIESIKDSLDNQIIGQVIVDDAAPFQVQLAVSSVLEELVAQGIIVTYQDVQARSLNTDPTVIEVRYSYLPAYAVKYIRVIFSINTSNGVVTSDLGEAA
jgi:hypothetical protein